MAYEHLAFVYDVLMQEMPYGQWVEWTEKTWQEDRPRTVLDLGCGTGNIAIPLAQKGYVVTGIDVSPEMLAVAYDKMTEARVQIRWVEQDMRELSVPPVDAVISFCDSLSYLTEEEDVKQTFRRVAESLKPGGWFLFDVHSPYKITHVFGDHTFTHLDEEINYIWDCVCDPIRLEVEHHLTFFLREENGLYRKCEETHVQRAYHLLSLTAWLKEAGFDRISVTADFTDLPPQQHSERLFFQARRGNR